MPRLGAESAAARSAHAIQKKRPTTMTMVKEYWPGGVKEYYYY